MRLCGVACVEVICDYNNYISTNSSRKPREIFFYNVDFNKFSLFNGLHSASAFEIGKSMAGLVQVKVVTTEETVSVISISYELQRVGTRECQKCCLPKMISTPTSPKNLGGYYFVVTL